MADVIAVLARAYPPELAESWDAVGLVCGDPDQVVSRVLIAVDPVPETVAEAVELSAQLLVTHHPLLLRGVHGVPADTPKGALVHRLIRAGVGLYTAHTNADSADPGVSDALAEALGVTVAGPLQPRAVESRDKLAVTVPAGAAGERLVAALTAAGATALADSSASGDGGRYEFVFPRRRRRPVVEALRAAHPESEPAFDIVELAPSPGRRGLGRVGELSTPETLAEFTQRAADALPATAWGVRAAGDPDRLIRRVAVCGGAGDSAFDAATASGADVYLTADLRHHPASEHVLAGSLPGRATPALVDVAHWASEHPWCHQAASVIERELGSTVEVCVSWRRTDPWTLGRT
jgi:dinuclear metal center YbgI/SA1388 family protein